MTDEFGTTESTACEESKGSSTLPESPSDTLMSAEAFWNSFEYRGLQQRFFVCRLGSTGSAYLARLINAHPDVFCSHEGVLWNRQDLSAGQSEREQQAFLAFICSDAMHGAYLANGDVGSAWLSYLRLAPKYCPVGNAGPKLVTGILQRHPLRVLNTQRHIAARELVTLPADATRIISDYFKDSGICCNIEYMLSVDERSFVWNCYQWREGAINGNCLDVQIHIERMNDLGYAQEKLLLLTGVEYGSELLSPLLGQVVNSRTGQEKSVEAIYAELPESHQTWYRAIVEDVADSIGYHR